MPTPRKRSTGDLIFSDAFYGGVLAKLLFGMTRGKKASMALLTAHASNRALYQIEGNSRSIHLLLKYRAIANETKRGFSWTFALNGREIGWILYNLAPCASYFKLPDGGNYTEDLFKEFARQLGYTDESSLDDDSDVNPDESEEVYEEVYSGESFDEEDSVGDEEDDKEKAGMKFFAEDCDSDIFLGLVCGHRCLEKGKQGKGGKGTHVKGMHSSKPNPVCLLGPNQLRLLLEHYLRIQPLSSKLTLGVRIRIPKGRGNAKMELIFNRRPLLSPPRNALQQLAAML